MKNKEKSHILILTLLFFGVILFGTFGYMLIEDYNFVEALFMAIITITTVGYGTIHKLSENGIIFTIILITSSFIIIGFIVQSLTRYVADGEIKKQIQKRKRNKIMKNTENHVIVCGYGLNGSHAVEELLRNKEKVVIIDIAEEIDEFNFDEENIIFIRGDAKKEEILKEAKIDKAKALISALSNDAENLFVVLTARELNPKLKIISRANEDTSDHKLRIAGADNVILPDSVGGVRMAKLVTEPNVIEFLDNILAKSGISVQLIEIDCGELNQTLVGKSISQLNIRRKSGANIIGMKKNDGTYIFNPSADLVIEAKDKLFVIGTPKQVEIFKQITLDT